MFNSVSLICLQLNSLGTNYKGYMNKYNTHTVTPAGVSIPWQKLIEVPENENHEKKIEICTSRFDINFYQK